MTDNTHTNDRRREILSAAEKVFEAKGYNATTVDQIAAAAGIAKGSIYNYFHGKQDLFTQLFTATLTIDEEEVDALIAADMPAGEKIERLLDNVFARFGQYTRIGGLILEFWSAAAREQRKGELALTFGQMYSQWRGRVASILAQGIRSGEFRSDIEPNVAASLIMAVMDGIIVQSILDVGIEVSADFLAALKRGLLAALRNFTAQSGAE